MTARTLTDEAAYAAAVETAHRAAAAYDGGGDPLLDDAAYDALITEIGRYEDQHADQVLPGSPTGKVAGGSVDGDVPHTTPMLSLDNVFDGGALARWAAGLERRLGRPVTAWSVEPKLDGIAVAARYRAGKLIQVLTRGDGHAGEDISHAIGSIVGLPVVLSEPADIEVRGEVLMNTAQFQAANQARIGHGGTPFANARSATAGSLRARNRPYAVEFTFFCYGVVAWGSLPVGALRGRPHSDDMHTAERLGIVSTLATPVGLRICTSLEQIQRSIDQIAAARQGLPFGIDGVVIKADAAADQVEAGFSSRAPRWAIAYKLPAVEKFTTLRAVEWNTGRTGHITPRGILEPVEVDGSTIGYATLHNAGHIRYFDLRIGDTVVVSKAGDIIPRIGAPVIAARTGAEQPVEVPAYCPNCGGDIDTSQERWRCLQGRACRTITSLLYAAGRDQLDIESLGETRARQLLDAGLVHDFADLFTLTADQLLSLERMGQASADNLLAALQKARTQPLSRVFCALGVRGTGRSMSRRIARHFTTMQAIRSANAAALQEVEGIGAVKAAMIVEELAELGPVIDKLIAAGLTMTEPRPAEQQPATGTVATSGSASTRPLEGMTVVVTGTMTGTLADRTRNQMNELIEQAGGKASTSVSARTDLLVAGDKAGSKLAKAQDLGVNVIGPQEFAQLLA